MIKYVLGKTISDQSVFLQIEWIPLQKKKKMTTLPLSVSLCCGPRKMLAGSGIQVQLLFVFFFLNLFYLIIFGLQCGVFLNFFLIFILFLNFT